MNLGIIGSGMIVQDFLTIADLIDDMKLEAICLKFYIWNLYPILLKFIMKLHKLKEK